MKSRDDLGSNATHSSPPELRLATWLIRRAARRSPSDLSDRLEEEWLADLSAHSGSLSQLSFALGCCWATRVIAHDPAFAAPVARAASARGIVVAYAPHNGSFFPQRATAWFLIVCLHFIVIYALCLSGAIKVPGLPSTRMKAVIIDERPQRETPPPLGVDTGHWSIDEFPVPDLPLPVPLGPIQISDEPRETSLAPQRPSGAVSESKAVEHISGGIGQGFPSTADYYPALSRQIGESGAIAVQVCVGSDGHLTAEPQIKQSSGSARLDAGAIALAKAGSGHYRIATEDGRPVTSCFPFRVRFELRK